MISLESIKEIRQELHNLNNHLTIVAGYIDMVLRESEDITQKNKDRLEQADKAAWDLAEAINNCFNLLKTPLKPRGSPTDLGLESNKM